MALFWIYAILIEYDRSVENKIGARSMSGIERVLVVDESESNLLFFEMVLQQTGKNFRIFTSTSANEAETLVKNENIQMVIAAWEMNIMPGTVLVQRLRNQRNRNLPCLIFSKRMKEEDVTLVREIGLEDILGMPFDKEKALEMIQKMIQREDGITPIEKKLRKIETLIFENKPAEALKLIDASMTKPGSHLIRALTLIGEIWISTRHLDKALESLTKALVEDSGYVPALRLMAKLHSLQGNHEQAIAMLEKMTAKSPSNIQSLISLGSAYIDGDEHEKARKILENIENLDEGNQENRDQKAKLAFKEGQYSLAAELLSETQHGDELARNFNNMAIIKVVNQQYDEGISIYKNAISILMDKAKLHQLYYNLGLAHRKKGELVEAFENFCESYCLDPTFDKSYNTLVKVSQELKEKGIKPNGDWVKKVKAARSEQTGAGS